jgi:hypothetical protein
VNACPAIVNVADRAPATLTATLKVTIPLPVPLAPDVTVTHGALLLAVHAQVAPVVTVTVPEPPSAGKF